MSQTLQFSKEGMKLKWNFQRGEVGGGGGTVQPKNLACARYGNFLQQHNNLSVVIQTGFH